MHTYHVCILSNEHRMLCTGVTRDLVRRVLQHRAKTDPDSYAARRRTDRLVYFETFTHIRDAIAREKQIKGWWRSRRVGLVLTLNPGWHEREEAIRALSAPH